VTGSFQPSRPSSTRVAAAAAVKDFASDAMLKIVSASTRSGRPRRRTPNPSAIGGASPLTRATATPGISAAAIELST
jgi:hypothetical protein